MMHGRVQVVKHYSVDISLPRLVADRRAVAGDVFRSVDVTEIYIAEP